MANTISENKLNLELEWRMIFCMRFKSEFSGMQGLLENFMHSHLSPREPVILPTFHWYYYQQTFSFCLESVEKLLQFFLICNDYFFDAVFLVNLMLLFPRRYNKSTFYQSIVVLVFPLLCITFVTVWKFWNFTFALQIFAVIEMNHWIGIQMREKF